MYLLKKIFVLLLLSAGGSSYSQELYVFTDPASNLPAAALAARVTGQFMGPQTWHNRPMQRYIPEVSFGLSKKWMLRVGGSFADMHTPGLGWESAFLYAKYRFYSSDGVHRHFRLAAFAEASHNRVPFHTDEINLQGDKGGFQVGLIATQLENRFAISASVSHIQVMDESRGKSNIIYIPSRIYQAMNYTLSAGYLLFPLEYKDYRQTNVNLYQEVLVQQSLDRKAGYIDLAPAVQFIFNSNTRLNFGYRFRVSGRMERMAGQSWLVSVERTFLNALKTK